MASYKLILNIMLLLALTLSSAFSKEQSKEMVDGHKELNKVITELADKLFLYNKLAGDMEEIAVTSFVDLHQLNKTTHFGRTVSEAFFDELFTRGFNVSDFRGQESLSINASGEYFLTRDIKLLNKDVTSAYILVGTYSLFEEKVLLNVRIIDNISGKILASARSSYLSSDCSIVEACKKPRRINIIGKNAKKMDRANSYATASPIAIKKHHFVKKQMPKAQAKKENPKKEIVVQTKTTYPLVNLIN